jgi:hypothetical protein
MTNNPPPIIYTSSCDLCGEEMWPEESVYFDRIKDEEDGSFLEGAEVCERCAYRILRKREKRT